MRSSTVASSLENFFPILAVENNCIISKNGDVTLCFKVDLPEIFTLSEQDYELLHSG